MMRRSLTLVEVVLVIVVVGIIFCVVDLLDLPFPFPNRHRREPAKRRVCAANLKQIYTAMQTYSEDYNGCFPMVTFGLGVVVGEDKLSTDLLHRDKGHCVSENLWLLCAGKFAQAEIFNCPSSEQAGQKLDLKTWNRVGKMKEVKDFPWASRFPTVISYSFVQPWSALSGNHTSAEMWRKDTDPRVVIGADGNNGKQPDYSQKGNKLDLVGIRDYVNSENHTGDGQNVLHGDGSCLWWKNANAGYEGDNIYTALSPDYGGKAGVSSGVLSVRPRDLQDTVLVPNREADLVKWNRKP
jgi:hypothetical protein